MIICDQTSHCLLENYASKIAEFLSQYEWVSEAYVSDFFYLDHWSGLAKCWQAALTDLSTEELSGLLDRGTIKTRQVLPLSLLSFARCTKTFAIDRECQKDFHAPFDLLFSRTTSIRKPTLDATDECTSPTRGQNVTQGSSNTVSEECTSPTRGQNVTQGSSNTISDECTSPTRGQNVTQGSSNTISDGFAEVDGKLHAFFRKHVKPKKQHEILNLAKVIYQLSKHISCGHVVDVGAGLGHLSRLLSFGYGLSVTSVEAAGSHAPKANKYDREIDRELKKRRLKTPKGNVEMDGISSSLPCHVTSMIYPDTTMEEFLAVVSSQRQAAEESSDELFANTHSVNSQTKIFSETEGFNSNKVSETSSSTVNYMETDSSKAKTEYDQCKATSTLLIDKGDTSDDKRNLETAPVKCSRKNSFDIDTEDGLKRHYSVDECNIDSKIAKVNQSDDKFGNLGNFVEGHTCSLTMSQGLNQNTCVCDKEKNKSKVNDTSMSFDKTEVMQIEDSKLEYTPQHETIKLPDQSAHCISGAPCSGHLQTGFDNKIETFRNDSAVSSAKDCEEKDQTSVDSDNFRLLEESTCTANCTKDGLAQVDKDKNVTDCDQSQVLRESGFILTGLHACGDLTPTFLRFFINCKAARGLASVGCCYMKISTSESGGEGMAGYPMSEAVRDFSNHKLTYNARELACHFADTYSQRLKDCPTHLKIHSYRAALEWLANQLCPDFKRSAVQLPSKKTNKMDFESYARLGLQKLGISGDQLTDDLLQKALSMTQRWKDVVVFYTLRLSLAPVIETLVLLDRMFFLYENGYNSALMPIFDPKLSPRNFVLLSWK